MRDHDLEPYKLLIDSIDVKHSEDAYLLVTGSKEDGHDKGCFKVAWLPSRPCMRLQPHKTK